MKTFEILFAVLLPATILFASATQAQDYFYYSHGEKIPLTLSDQEITIKFRSGATPLEKQSMVASEPSLGELSPMGPPVCEGFVTCRLREKVDVRQLLARLQAKAQVDIVDPVFFINGRTKAQVYDHFLVQFFPSVTMREIEALNASHHVEVVRGRTGSPNLYVLRVTNASDLSVLDMANRYHESPLVLYSLPDFLTDTQILSIPNDPYFANQYYLRNLGQTGGVSGADINVTPAWDITTGTSSITVAVIDAGGMAQEDIPLSRIVAGYDFYYGDRTPVQEATKRMEWPVPVSLRRHKTMRREYQGSLQIPR